MTAEFAKWSVLALVALSTVILVSRDRSGEGAAAVVTLLINAWFIVAICVWWRN